MHKPVQCLKENFHNKHQCVHIKKKTLKCVTALFQKLQLLNSTISGTLVEDIQ